MNSMWTKHETNNHHSHKPCSQTNHCWRCEKCERFKFLIAAATEEADLTLNIGKETAGIHLFFSESPMKERRVAPSHRSWRNKG